MIIGDKRAWENEDGEGKDNRSAARFADAGIGRRRFLEDGQQ